MRTTVRGDEAGWTEADGVRTRLGDRIRAYRTARGLTLEQVGKHAGVSSSFLSQIERGRSGASVRTLTLIAEALGLTMSDLFDDAASGRSRVLRRDERPTLRADGVTKFLLSKPPLQNVEMLEGIFDLGATTGGPEYVHGDSQELIYVLEGEVQLDLAEEQHLLRSGDCAEFRSSVPHALANVGASQARVMWIIAPPTSRGIEDHDPRRGPEAADG